MTIYMIMALTVILGVPYKLHLIPGVNVSVMQSELFLHGLCVGQGTVLLLIVLSFCSLFWNLDIGIGNALLSLRCCKS